MINIKMNNQVNERKIGIIGGSGIYDLPDIKTKRWIRVSTPWGNPSDEILEAEYEGKDFYFLPRHGRKHLFSPSDINYQANIYALKELGVNEILSFSACGSLDKNMKPGDFVLIDQYIDNTKHRASSFFGKGLVAHVPFGNPNCNRILNLLRQVFEKLEIHAHFGGTYLAMEGPQFSSRSESFLYKDIWNCQVIGMTNMPEAKLAREAEICYQTVAMVTDFDCWNDSAPHVTLDEIKKIFDANLSKMQEVIKEYFRQGSNPNVFQSCQEGCNDMLKESIVTHREHWDKKMFNKLRLILDKYS